MKLVVLYTFFHFLCKNKTLYYPIITDGLWSIRKGIILHRVQSTRVSLQSSELGPPTALPASEFPPPPPTWVLWGQTLACVRGGGGGPNSDDWTENLELYIV
jgi:hypothetical protein